MAMVDNEPRIATIKAMDEITGPIVAITLGAGNIQLTCNEVIELLAELPALLAREGARVCIGDLQEAVGREIAELGPVNLAALDELEGAREQLLRADEVDADGLRAEHADLRGLDAVSFGRPDSLRGVTLTHRQVELAATDFARALGIDVQD